MVFYRSLVIIIVIPINIALKTTNNYSDHAKICLVKALQIKNLKKTYPPSLQVLKGIDIEVDQGDFFALLGPNGAGKSTTIGIITSLVKKTSGKVFIFGMDTEHHVIETKKLIGVVPQIANFPQFETPLEILLNQGGFYGINRRTAYQRAEKYLRKMDLWDKCSVPSRTLSGGMQRKLMITRALISQPKLLFLDEPTAGVDVESRRAIWDFLSDMNKQGTTIVLTTHYLEEAESLCKKIAIIDHGIIVENTSIKSLLSSLQTESFIFDLKQPHQTEPNLQGYSSQMLDASTLQVSISKSQSLNQLFQQLSMQNIDILSMRNKTNRLEELFMGLLQNNNQPEEEA